jgi:hypothetical protein
LAKKGHVSETPATAWLKRHAVAYTEHPYDYVEHGGTAVSAAALGVDEHAVVKTLVMEDEHAKPLIVLMHGNAQVSTKNLARQIGAKSVQPCKPEVANRHVWLAQGDAHLRGIVDPGSRARLHQWRPTRFSCVHRSNRVRWPARSQAS